MITELHATGYGCLKDVRVKLGGLHALIGPNDSGKSTILRALRTLGQLASGSFERRGTTWAPFDPGLDADEPGSHVTLRAQTPDGSYIFERRVGGGVSALGKAVTSEERVEDLEIQQRAPRLITSPSVFEGSPPGFDATALWLTLSGIHFLGLSEEGLRSPSGFLPRGRTQLSARGEGLPGLYFALRNDHEEAFERILQDVRTLFPTVKTVRAQPSSSSELEIEVELTDRTRVRAAHISTGLLYYLAFAALPEAFGPVSTVLLEEPENGLHPARIKQVMAVLRAFTEKHGAQVILTTHSPLVVNELEPKEVSVVTRPTLETGTQVRAITETANFAKRSEVYSLGELWLSYADGNVEEALFDPKVR
jgi:ABC-type transport system involved in cytochrome c biogenesis ATPase subunit